MEEINKMSGDEAKIQSLLVAFFSSRRTLKSSAAETSFHLDEDSLAAFTEGNLAERESMPIVDHLVRCGFCRHRTAELLRLAVEFEGTDNRELTPLVSAAEPSKISEVLSGLLAKIFGSSDQAVFAHEEKDSEEDSAEKESAENEEKNKEG